MKIYESQIEDEVMVCPYCGDQKGGESYGCCGESSCHFEKAYIVGDKLYLASEVVVLKDSVEIYE